MVAWSKIVPVATLGAASLLSGVGLFIVKPISALLVSSLLISGSNLVSTAASLAIGHLVDKKIMSARCGFVWTLAISALILIVNVVVFTFLVVSPGMMVASAVVSLVVMAMNLRVALVRVEQQIKEECSKRKVEAEELVGKIKKDDEQIEKLGEEILEERKRFNVLMVESARWDGEMQKLREDRS